MKILTYSAMRRFRECPRRYYYEYILRLRPIESSAAIRRGKLVHEMLDAATRHGIEAAVSMPCESVDAYTFATATALVAAYVRHYGAAGSIRRVIDSERVFEIPLTRRIGGKTKAISRTYRLAGKIDRIVELQDGCCAVIETKTITTISEGQLRMLAVDPQLTIYLAAARKEYPALRIDRAIYDMIRWPSISPERATPPEKRKYTRDGRLYANQRETDEEPAAWHERLFDDVMSRTDYYFIRREVRRLDDDMDQLLNECWDIATFIKTAEAKSKWWRNVGVQCGFCPHTEHCCGLVDLDRTPVPDGFEVVATEHPELEESLNGRQI